MKILKVISNLLTKICCLMIRFYQKCVSPFLPACCRFYPSCSHYAIEAFNKYGPMKGMFLTTKRLLRCNPYCKGGFDPVP